MVSLKLMFKDLVENKRHMKVVKTKAIQQDPVEIFFGNVRSLGGHNDNPTCEQFISAFRKLLAYSTVMYSKYSNCSSQDDEVSSQYSNITSITSKRRTNVNVHDFSEVTEESIDEFYQKLNEIENLNHSNDSYEFEDYTVAHIAKLIENRINSTKQYKCPACMVVFEENIKMDKSMFVDTKSGQPLVCQSTFLICKQVNRFLKPELLTGSNEFKVIYHEILKSIAFEELYTGTDFRSHSEHKIFLVRYVIDEYIRIKMTHIARSATFKERENTIRVRLHKLMHFLGQ